MKNFLIVILLIACGGLVYLLLNQPESEPCPTCPPPQIVEKEIIIEKIPPYDVIKKAVIHGISLETPLDQVDMLTEKAGYECKTTEREKNDAISRPKAKSWVCKHPVLGSPFHINAVNDEITKLAKSGAAYETDMDATLDHLDKLKIQLNTKKGFNTSQDDKDLTFQIHHKKEDGTLAFIKYHINYTVNKDEETQPGKGGVLTAIITR